MLQPARELGLGEVHQISSVLRRLKLLMPEPCADIVGAVFANFGVPVEPVYFEIERPNHC